MHRLSSKLYKISKLDSEKHSKTPWLKRQDFPNLLPKLERRWTKLTDLLTPFKQIRLDGFKMPMSSNPSS